jgi:hypothetical protein
MGVTVGIGIGIELICVCAVKLFLLINTPEFTLNVGKDGGIS